MFSLFKVCGSVLTRGGDVCFLLQLKARIAKSYGVAGSIITLKFDGDKLGDSDTAEGVGIEDDDLIDVQVTC